MTSPSNGWAMALLATGFTVMTARFFLGVSLFGGNRQGCGKCNGKSQGVDDGLYFVHDDLLHMWLVDDRILAKYKRKKSGIRLGLMAKS